MEEQKALSEFIQNELSHSFTGEVTKVNGDSIDVKVGEFEYFDVKLKSITGGELGLLVTPKLGSKVFCVNEGGSKEQFVAVRFDEIEKLELKIGEQSLMVDKVGWIFNNGDLGGVTVAKELKKQLEKLTARVDAIFDGFAELSPDAPQMGSATVTTGLKAIVSPPDREDFSKIENEKIKQ